MLSMCCVRLSSCVVIVNVLWLSVWFSSGVVLLVFVMWVVVDGF